MEELPHGTQHVEGRCGFGLNLNWQRWNRFLSPPPPAQKKTETETNPHLKYSVNWPSFEFPSRLMENRIS